MKVRQEYNLKKTDGEVGIEVEIEGVGVQNITVTGWNTVGDGSLRGEAAEFVLRRPVAFKKVPEYLFRLHKALDGNIVIEDSDRCGVHVHINCQELNFKQTLNFIILFLVFEQMLVNYCGEDREGNLFCLRAKDAEAILVALNNSAISNSFGNMQKDTYRYAAINLSALRKYGSLEFRSLSTPSDVRTIEIWVKLLHTIFEKAADFNNPSDIIEAVSFKGSYNFAREIFGTQLPLFNLHADMINDFVYDGIRRAQDIAYSYMNSKWSHKIDTAEIKKAASHNWRRIARAPTQPMMGDTDGPADNAVDGGDGEAIRTAIAQRMGQGGNTPETWQLTYDNIRIAAGRRQREVEEN